MRIKKRRVASVLLYVLVIVAYYWLLPMAKLIFNSATMKPVNITSTPATTTTTKRPFYECKPVFDCINLDSPSLKKLKQGSLKPDPLLRWIYLNTRDSLSNLLLELSVAIAISRATCSKIKIRSNYYMPSLFNDSSFVQQVPHSKYQSLTTNVEKFEGKTGNDTYDNIIQSALKNDIVISQVMPSHKMFSGCQNYILKKLQFNEDHVKEARVVIKDILRQNGHIDAVRVGVHIARNDDLKEYNSTHEYTPPDADYYKNSMEYFRNKYLMESIFVVFIVSTDDVNFYEQQFRHSDYPDVFMIQTGVTEVELVAMTMCDHLIKSPGSFGTWLSLYIKGETISPETYNEKVPYRIN